MVSDDLRPKFTLKDQLKKFNAKRYQTSISNINFKPHSHYQHTYRRARKSPTFKSSESLNFDPQGVPVVQLLRQAKYLYDE